MNLSVTNKKWHKKEYDERFAIQLVEQFHLKEIQARLLAERNLQENPIDFLNPKIKNLMPNPKLILDIDKGYETLLETIKNGEKILIWGDYDVDGISSVTIMYNFLKELGFPADFYIPDRFKDGYGVHVESLQKIKNLSEYGLIIIVDCGSNDLDAINFLKQLGKKIIILDHHIVQNEELVNVDAFINIKRKSDQSHLENICATALVFMFIVFINKRLCNALNIEKEIQIIKFVDIVALATVCDVMPLSGLNRAFVKTGVSIMKNTTNSGLRELLSQLNIKNPSVSDIGFTIGPCLNAAGRIGNSNLAANLLTGQNNLNLKTIASEIILLNQVRKSKCDEIFQEAIKQAYEKSENKFMLLWNEGWHEGIIGIVASKIKDIFAKPCCLVAFSKNSEIGKGSGRSIDEFDLGNAIISAEKFLVNFGGHKKAVGFSVEKSKIQLLDEYLQKISSHISSSPTIEIDAEISLEAINIENYADIYALEPFGEGNPEPIFQISNIFITNVRTFAEKHISCTLLSENGSTRDGYVFNALGTPIGTFLTSDSISETKRYSIAGRFIKNERMNRINFVIADIKE